MTTAKSFWNDYMQKHPYAEGHKVLEAYAATLSSEAPRQSAEPIPVDEDHPILAAILRVRHRNAGNFAPSRSGSLGEARDDTLLEILREVKAVLNAGDLLIVSRNPEDA